MRMMLGALRAAMVIALAIAFICALRGGAAAAQLNAAMNVPPDGFSALFNGRDLEGWWGLGTEDPAVWRSLPPDELAKKREQGIADIQAHWRIEGGELINDGEGLCLTTLREFGDFELMLQYKTVPDADSGVYLRGCPQVQIWDTTEAGGKWKIGAEKGSGGLWNNSPGAPGKNPLVHADLPFGQWNQMRIIMIGDRVTVYLNEKLVVNDARMENFFNRDRPLPRRGPIQLQTHGGEIRWRNVFIREIDGADQPQSSDASKTPGETRRTGTPE